MQARSLWRDPRLITLTLLQFCIMGAYSTLLSSLELYLTNKLHISTSTSYAILAVFISPVLILPLISGYIGDHMIGHFNATVLGMLITLAGFITLTLSPQHAILIGLALIQCGINLLTPNVFVLVGRNFPVEGAYRDSAFTINYAGMNFGAIIGMSITGYIVRYFGQIVVFSLGAMLFVICLIIMFGLKRFIQYKTDAFKPKAILITIITMLISVVISYYLLVYATTTNILLIITGILALAALGYLIKKHHHFERKKISTYLILSLFTVSFFTIFSLSPSLVLNFIQHDAKHIIFHINIPTQSIYALAAIFVTLYGVIISQVWLFFKRKNKEIHTPYKIAIGIALLGLCYLNLFTSTQLVGTSSKIAFGWLIAFYAIHSLGEICVVPSGYSMVGTLAPKKLEGFFQGVWALTIGLGVGISSYVARLSAYNPNAPSADTVHRYGHAFISYFVVLSVIAILLWILSPKLSKIFIAIEQARNP